MTTVQPPAGLDLEAIRERAEAASSTPWPSQLWAIAKSVDDVPAQVAEVGALRRKLKAARTALAEALDWADTKERERDDRTEVTGDGE